MDELTKEQQEKLKILKDHLFKLEETKLKEIIKRLKKNRESLNKILSCKIDYNTYMNFLYKCESLCLSPSELLRDIVLKELEGGKE